MLDGVRLLTAIALFCRFDVVRLGTEKQLTLKTSENVADLGERGQFQMENQRART